MKRRGLNLILVAVGVLLATNQRNGAIPFRRMLGLFAFFYGSRHFLTYIVADRLTGLDFPAGIVAWQTVNDLARATVSDVLKRPFVTVGVAAWLCVGPLAITSTAGTIRRLGGRRWQLLHRLTYAAAAAAVPHYFLLLKADVRRPEAYALGGFLLAFRAWWWGRSAKAPVTRRVAA